MFHHSRLVGAQLIHMIRKGHLAFAGNAGLKIYGHLKCGSGKRIKKTNRVFFGTEDEALAHGFRPCGNCMRTAYQKWKNGLI